MGNEDGQSTQEFVERGWHWWLSRVGVPLAVCAVTAAVAVYVAVYVKDANSSTAAPKTSTPTMSSAAPVGPAALDGLLLNPAEINSAMGTTGMVVAETPATMDADIPNLSEMDCEPLSGNLIAGVYAGSGWTAVRELGLYNPSDKWGHYVDQGVALFSSARDADAFFATSAQKWPACANRRYTLTVGNGHATDSTGPVVNVNGTLSVTVTGVDVPLICERALTVANNVIADIRACYDRSKSVPGVGVNIAHQIAAKVSTT